MMYYSDLEGTFPLTMVECKIIYSLCSDRISEIENSIDNADSHVYVNLKMIEAKMDGFIKLMKSKSEKTNDNTNVLSGITFEEVTI